jgi:hypothetical protein
MRERNIAKQTPELLMSTTGRKSSYPTHRKP